LLDRRELHERPALERGCGTLANASLLEYFLAERFDEPVAELDRARKLSGFDRVAFEVLEHLLRRRVALRRILRERFADDAVEPGLLREPFRRKVGDVRAARLRKELAAIAVGLVELSAREELPEHDPGGEHIGARVERRLPIRLLRAHVPGLALDRVLVERLRRVGRER